MQKTVNLEYDVGMNRTGQVLLEVLVAAIFLIFFIPIVQEWSADLGGKTTLHRVEQEAAAHNREIYGGR